MRSSVFTVPAVAAFIIAAAVQLASAQPADQFVRFDEFLAATRVARFERFAHLPGARVTSAQAFEEMRRHILSMYDGVVQVSSFVSEGAYADCITIETQPTVRKLGTRAIATPPPASILEGAATRREPAPGVPTPTLFELGGRDPFGNAIGCRRGTIPMQRLTLERMTRYTTLRDFFAKSPNGGDRRGHFLPELDGARLHSVGTQDVANWGGNSWLNVWIPPGGPFSTSQQWYVARTSQGVQQTVEGGAVYDPSHFGRLPVLFVFWTATDYKKGTSCYNLECPGFVQTGPNYLGGAFAHYSATGGEQWGFTMQWKLYHGQWWMFVKGGGAYEAVGYYPVTLFSMGGFGGLDTHATTAQFGGESARNPGGPWAPEGSGELAQKGWRRAAYQKQIFYINGEHYQGVGTWANLNQINTSEFTCHTVEITDASRGGSWGTYLYFGGPGGMTCDN